FWLRRQRQMCIRDSPGIALYKAVNTADSMIGHRSERYEYFGKCAARLDDILNFLPARYSGGLLSDSAFTFIRKGNARHIMRRDARKHLSWNAGWPEAAMAGALEVRLGGPRRYGDLHVDGAWLGDGREDLGASDIRRGLRIYVRATIFCAIGFGLLSAAWLGMVLLGQS
ncbi:MAG: cobalamin biosynthesis protein, partial [Parvibaculaceae bacterium]|nr:cobalamin biosynthesis protein [Parvibaculaceae bacterium]